MTIALPWVVAALGLCIYLAPTGELKSPGLYAFAVGLLVGLMKF